MVRRAAKSIDNNEAGKNILVAAAKRYATDASTNIVDEAIQIHGGYAYLSKYELERYYRDIRVHEILEGTNEIMKTIMARQWLKE
jgi:alkylation response protein AidB-like acyl-CoA dehydrogenase